MKDCTIVLDRIRFYTQVCSNTRKFLEKIAHYINISSFELMMSLKFEKYRHTCVISLSVLSVSVYEISNSNFVFPNIYLLINISCYKAVKSNFAAEWVMSPHEICMNFYRKISPISSCPCPNLVPTSYDKDTHDCPSRLLKSSVEVVARQKKG